MFDITDPIFDPVRSAVSQDYINELSRILQESDLLTKELNRYKAEVNRPILVADLHGTEGGETNSQTRQITVQTPANTTQKKLTRDLRTGKAGFTSDPAQFAGVLAHELGHVFDPDVAGFRYNFTDVANEFKFLFVAIAGEGKAAFNNYLAYDQVSKASSSAPGGTGQGSGGNCSTRGGCGLSA